MTESETETETIDRLEAALRKIAAAAEAAKNSAAEAAKFSAVDAIKTNAAHAPQRAAPTAAPDLDRDALKNSLDTLITRLRAGLTPPPAHPIITE